MTTDAPELTVFYDGGCPVCRMEVRWYQRRDNAQAIDWVDIEALRETDLPEGKTRGELLGRFHARDRSGGWHVGVDAFARIWREQPVLHRFAFVFRLPVIRQAAELGYHAFLAWQRRHRARRKGRDRPRETA